MRRVLYMGTRLFYVNFISGGSRWIKRRDLWLQVLDRYVFRSGGNRKLYRGRRLR